MSPLANRWVPETQFTTVTPEKGPEPRRRVTRISCVTRADHDRSLERTRGLLYNMNVHR